MENVETEKETKFNFKLQLVDVVGIPLPLFDLTASELRQLLTSIEVTKFGGLAHAKWIVDTDQLQITASANGLSASELKDVIADTYQAFEAGNTDKESDWPSSFNEPERKIVRRIISRIKKAANVTKIEAIGHEPLLIKRTRDEHIKKSRRETYSAWSSIDGKLDVISVHRQPSFVIYEHGTQHRIRCVFPDEWLDRVKDYLGLRVMVEGFVYYREDGSPVMLSQPTSIERVPIPKQEDISVYRGSLSGITGGMSSYEYVRQLRESDA
jgi:hypothetical protein